MQASRIHRASAPALIVLSIVALLAVLSGYARPPRPDEGAAAHVFQPAIAALVPVTLVHLTSAGWTRPWRGARALALPAAVVALAFGALYLLEHRR